MSDLSLSSKFKQLFNHGIIYGLTSSLQNILGFVLLPLLTQYYNPSEFGIYSIILLITALASAIFYFGASSALGRFYYEEDSDEYRKKIVSSTLIITLIGAVILITMGIILSRNLSQLVFNDTKYALPISLSLASGAFIFLLNTMTLLLRYQKRSILFMAIIIFGVLLNFIVTYTLLTKFNYGILAPIYGTLISSFASFSYLFLAYLPQFTLHIHKSHLKLIFSFGIQSSITGLLFYLLDWIDRLILKELLPMADVGIYSLGYKIAAVINILLITPFALIWAPMRMENHKNKDNESFMAKVTSYYSIIGFTLILISILFANDLMTVFFKNSAFAAAEKVFPIIMCALLFYGFQNIVDYGIYIHKKIYFYIIISIGAILFNVTMNYWLIPKFGYISSAYITLITYFLTSCFLYLISNKYYKLNLEWNRILWPFIGIVFVFILINFTSVFASYSILKKSLLLLLFVTLIFKIWLRKSEYLELQNIFIKK